MGNIDQRVDTMQLTVKDAAYLLNVSEKTIYRWIKQEIIPVYRINEQLRFNRAELLEWATSRRIQVSPEIFNEGDKPETPLPSLSEAIKAGGISYRLGGSDKPSVLRALIDVIKLPEEVDQEFLFQVLLAALRQVLGAHGRLFFGTFPSEVRPEHVADATLELVKRYANNDSLVIGAQSGSQRMLEHCGRGHRVDDIFSAVSRSLAAGFKPLVDFIFGLPGETREDLQATIEVIQELAAMGALIHAHTFLPLPQTRFADAPAGRIHGRLRTVMRELIRRGTLFGVWDKQETEAQRITRERRQESG